MIWNHTTPSLAEPLELPKLPASFVGQSGRFYIRIRRIAGGFHHRTAVYSSIVAYNNRSEKPCYIDATEALDDFNHEVQIFDKSLTTIPPDCSTSSNKQKQLPA